MRRYVLFARSSDAVAEADRIRRMPGLTIVDETGDRSMLVDATDDAVTELRSTLKDWLVEPEVAYPRPGPHRYSVGSKKR